MLIALSALLGIEAKGIGRELAQGANRCGTAWLQPQTVSSFEGLQDDEVGLVSVTRQDDRRANLTAHRAGKGVSHTTDFPEKNTPGIAPGGV